MNNVETLICEVEMVLNEHHKHYTVRDHNEEHTLAESACWQYFGIMKWDNAETDIENYLKGNDFPDIEGIDKRSTALDYLAYDVLQRPLEMGYHANDPVWH